MTGISEISYFNSNYTIKSKDLFGDFVNKSLFFIFLHFYFDASRIRLVCKTDFTARGRNKTETYSTRLNKSLFAVFDRKDSRNLFYLRTVSGCLTFLSEFVWIFCSRYTNHGIILILPRAEDQTDGAGFIGSIHNR